MDGRFVRVLFACAAAFGAAASGCGGPSRRTTADLEAEAFLDPGVELAARLPRGAHRCTVARPAVTSATRRGLYLRLALSEPTVWLPDAPFSAVASAARTEVDGSVIEVLLARTTAPRDEVRRWLRTRAPLQFAWEGDDGEDEEEQPLEAFTVSFDDEHTLRLAHGAWPDEREVGVERRCVELAAAERRALELSSGPREIIVLGAYAHVPRAVETLAYDRGTALETTRRLLLRAAPSAAEGMDEITMTEEPRLGPLPVRTLAEEVRRYREGASLVTRMRLRWEDVALALADARLIDDAITEDQRMNAPLPGSEIDVSSLATVERQKRLWLEELTRQTGAGRELAARELSTLLERAIAAHPTESSLRQWLFDLFLKHLRDGVRAAGVAEEALAANVGDALEWRAHRRAALARVSAERLRDALVEDAVLDRVRAERAAPQLVALVAADADYAFSEGAWIASDALLARTDQARGAVRGVPHASLPLDTLFDALSIVLEGGDRGGALYVAVEGETRPWTAFRWDEILSPVVELERGGRRVLVGAASVGAGERLSALGRSIGDRLSSGRASISFFSVPLGGSPDSPDAWGHLEGTLSDGAFVVERAAGPAARVRWDRVRRYLADPLAAASERVFPPPEVVVETESTRDAEALLSAADAEPGVRCQARAELRIECAASPEASNALRGLLVRFSTDRLRDETRRLLGR